MVFAAAFFFILANTFPFLTLQANYRQSSMHLVGCVSGLARWSQPSTIPFSLDLFGKFKLFRGNFQPPTMKILLLILLSFATLVRGDDPQEAIKVIETQNHVKFIGQAPINGSDRTQWVFAAPDTANGIRIRIHVISFPSRLEYLAAELSAYGEAKAAYEQSKEPKREHVPTPLEQAVGARLETGEAFGSNPTTGAYQIYNVNTKKWRPIQ